MSIHVDAKPATCCEGRIRFYVGVRAFCLSLRETRKAVAKLNRALEALKGGKTK